MRVNILCSGRFLSFELAGQLKRLGCLGGLFTCTNIYTPHLHLEEYRLVREDIKSLFFADGITRVVNALQLPRSFKLKANWLKLKWFHRWSAKRMGACDVIHAWACNAISAFDPNVSKGAVRILDRSSMHRRAASKLLTEEYLRYNSKYIDDFRGMKLELDEYNLADAIIVPSTFVMNSFINEGFPRDKVFVVPFGSLISGVGPPRSVTQKFRILFVGGLTVRKGIRYFLEAIPQIAGLEDLEVVIVGPHPEKYVEPYLRKYLNDYGDIIKYLGYRSKNELYSKIYPSASVLVQPSILEGMSYVLLESLAHGVPVIATENTGAMDIISDNKEGFVVPIREPDAIAERIVHLYKNRDILEKMSKNALLKAKTQFTWEKYGDRIVGIYEKLINHK